MVLKTFVNFFATKRVPLIKFRKGGPVMSATESQPQIGVSSSQQQPGAIPRGAVIEDWQLPARYRRKPIDSVEMDYINRGGPA